MKTHFKTIIFSIICGVIVGGIVLAANTFPTTLNAWVTGDTIESDWANSLESKIGADSSTVTSSLDYLVEHSSSTLGKIASIVQADGTFLVSDGTLFVGKSTSSVRTLLDIGDAGTWASTSYAWASSSLTLLNASGTEWNLGYIWGFTYNASSGEYNLAYTWASTYNASSGEYDLAYVERGSQMGGRSITFGTQLDIDSEIYERPIAFNFPDATNTIEWMYKTRSAITLLRVSCNSIGGTTTFNFLERSEDSPNTGGTTTLSSSLVCGSSGTASSTTFTDSGIAANGIVVASTTAVVGTDVDAYYYLEFSIND